MPREKESAARAKEEVSDTPYTADLQLAAPLSLRYSFLGGPYASSHRLRAVRFTGRALRLRKILHHLQRAAQRSSVHGRSLIARIAGKPATSPSLAAVATEPKSFHIQIDPDARFAAAVGGAARYLADAAGL